MGKAGNLFPQKPSSNEDNNPCLNPGGNTSMDHQSEAHILEYDDHNRDELSFPHHYVHICFLRVFWQGPLKVFQCTQIRFYKFLQTNNSISYNIYDIRFVQALECANISFCRCLNMQIFFGGVLTCKYQFLQVSGCANISFCKCLNVQIYKTEPFWHSLEAIAVMHCCGFL